MKKILIITYYWPPSGGGGVQRWLKFVKYLPSYGWKPVVVAPLNPEYPVIDKSLEKDIPPEAEIIKLPIWEPYWIFKKITGRKKEEKVNTGLLFDEKKQTLTEKISLWIRGNFLIPDPRLFWVKSSVRRLKNMLPTLGVEAIITTGPPHSVHLIGYGLSKHTKIPWIADLRDPWSNLDLLDKFYPCRLARFRHRKIEKRALTKANQVITVSPTWAKELQNTICKPVEVITNGFDKIDLNKNNVPHPNRFVLCYLGIINSFRNQNTLWESLNEICEQNEDFRKKLVIEIVGIYDNRLEESIAGYPFLSDKLVFSGYIPHSEVKNKYAQSDCLLLLQNRTKNAMGHIPGKVFEYLASRKPILAIADPKSDIGKIIRECKAGFVCNFDDKETIKKSLLSVFEMNTESPAPEKLDLYTRLNLTGRLLEVVQQTIEKIKTGNSLSNKNAKEKILIITYYWPPSGGAGVQRWVKFAKYLTRFDFDPWILTVDPKYATYPQIDNTLQSDIPETLKVFYTRSFELYSLYKRISSNKEIPYGGFANTQKVNLKEKIIRFIRGNFFLPDPRKGWNRYAFRKAKEIILANGIKTMITSSPPHSTQLVGLKLKKTLNIKWIADFRDPWTDIYYYRQMYPTRLSTAINKKMERVILEKSDKIITVSHALKRLFAGKAKNIDARIGVIPNGFDQDDFARINTEAENETFYISYVGTISKEYNIDGFIRAINQLPEKVKSKIRLRFVGKITPELVGKMYNTGLKDLLEIKGYVNHEVAIRKMTASGILLLIIPDVKNNEGILTGKLFEYLATGRPILFLGPEQGDAAAVIRETGSGMVCRYDDDEKISHFIQTHVEKKAFILTDYQQRQKYSRENLTKELVKIIRQA